MAKLELKILVRSNNDCGMSVECNTRILFRNYCANNTTIGIRIFKYVNNDEQLRIIFIKLILFCYNFLGNKFQLVLPKLKSIW